MWKRIKENRDWMLIFLGAGLIITAALNLTSFTSTPINEGFNTTPAVEQAGSAPIFIPVETAEVDQTNNKDQDTSTYPPERLLINKIGLDAPIKLARTIAVNVDGRDAIQFLVPEEFAVGWHENSATLGIAGNTVLSGHHNTFGEVFKGLVDLEVGDSIIITSGAKEFTYIIANRMILPEKDQPLNKRLANARWISPSEDERVTLVTCWPARSNTHRLILVAVPADSLDQAVSPTTPLP